MFYSKVIKKLIALATVVFSSSGVAMAEEQVEIPYYYDNFKEAKAEFTATGPTLIFSDSPEMVYKNGILYRDVVQGPVRLFFHHVNAVEGKKKLAVLVKNKNSLAPVKLTVKRKGVGGRNVHWVQDGKDAEERYFSQQTSLPKYTLGFGNSVELLSGKGELLQKDELLTGFIDFELEGKAEISVLMCESKSDIEIFSEAAEIQPMDEHPLRGTFPRADWNYRLKRAVKPGKKDIRLELASSDQGFIKGVDKTTGLAAENYGNYGVIYNVDFEIAGNQKVQLIFNPIGGEFAGYGTLLNKTTGEEQLLAIPGDGLSFGENMTEARSLAILEKGAYRFSWAPPGAGNLPIRLFWRNYKAK